MPDALDCHCVASRALTPFQVPNLTMNGRAFDSVTTGTPGNAGTDEWLLNLSAMPSSTLGLTQIGSGFLGNTSLGISPVCGGVEISMTWAAAQSFVSMQYGNGVAIAGGVALSFTSPTTGLVTWPTNTTPMNVGEERFSNPLLNGLIAKFTHEGFFNDGTGTSMAALCGLGTESLRIHYPANNTVPVKFRISFYKI